MDKLHKKRLVVALLTLLLVFLLLFLLGFHHYVVGQKLLTIGLSASVQSLIIMIFSVLSMGNVIIELMKVK